MSAPNCPSGYSLVQGTCLTNCANGTVVVPSNTKVCVSSISCSTGTIPDGTGLSCLKVAPIGVQSATGGSCSTGYTLWSSNTCYINCPSGFFENGTECARVVYPRSSEDPTCSGLFVTLSNDKCVASGWQIFTFLAILALCVLTLALIVTFIVKRSRAASYTRPYMYHRPLLT
jgi:hypothetical protein